MPLEFSRVWVLAFLALLPMALRRRRAPTVAWPGAARLGPLASRWPDRLTTLLKWVVATALILALTGPRVPTAGSPLEADGVDLMLVVDVSGSMAEVDFATASGPVSRWDAVRQAFAALVERRPGDRIGLVLFATHPESTCPLTLDHAALLRRLRAATPLGLPGENETNLGDAIAWGLDRVRAATGDKLLVVCSDGEHNVAAPALTPRQSAQLAAAAGVPVYTIYAGPASGPGRASLETVAHMTGGTAFTAGDADGLAEATARIDALATRLAESPRRRRYQEFDGWLALSALVGLAGLVGLRRGPWLVTPG